jgi:hypothetical protein
MLRLGLLVLGQLALLSGEFRRQCGGNLFWRVAQHCKVIDLFGEKENR